MRAHASNEAEPSKSNGSAVIAAGGELYSGPAARSAVQIQAQQVQIRTAISWISTGPHPDARSISPRHRRPYGRQWPPASLHTHLAVTAIRPCAVCQSGLSPTTGKGAKLKENRTRRLSAHCTRPRDVFVKYSQLCSITWSPARYVDVSLPPTLATDPPPGP